MSRLNSSCLRNSNTYYLIIELFCLLMSSVRLNAQKTGEIALFIPPIIKVGKEIHANLTCVATGSKRDLPLVLNVPINSKLKIIETETFSDSLENPLNCNFTTLCYNSTNPNSAVVTIKDDLVKDERWEDLTVRITTKDRPYNSIFKSNRLIFSVFGSESTDIEFGGDRRYCKFILSMTSVTIQLCAPRCQTIIANHPQSGPILKANMWTTFIIKYSNDSKYEVGISSNYNDKQSVLLATFIADQLFVTRIKLISSTKVYWKIHELTVLSVTENTDVSKEFPSRGHLCLSFYVKMTDQWVLRIYMYDRSKWEELETIKQAMGSWQKHTIHYDGQSIASVLFRATIGMEGGKMLYIDDIIDCSDHQDFKATTVLVSNEGAHEDIESVNCQVLYDVAGATITKRKPSPASVEDRCELSKIGPNCQFNCAQLFGSTYCEGMTICTDTKCVCSPGYYGLYCFNPCLRNKTGHKSYNKYGQDCSTPCHHCKALSTCSPIDGNCGDSGCEMNYFGDKCDTLKMPVLINPPMIIMKSDRKLNVQVTNWTLTGFYGPETYQIEYKLASAHAWSLVGSKRTFKDNEPIEISPLEARTAYKIRVILITESGGYYDGDEVIPVLEVTTDCTGPPTYVTPNDINVSLHPNSLPWQVSAKINLKISESNCDANSYSIEVVGILDKINSDNVQCTVPWSTYLHIQVSRDNVIRATKIYGVRDGPSSEIRNLTVTGSSADSVSIKWQKPKYPGGASIHYTVTCRHVQHKACLSSTLLEEATTHTTEQLSFTIDELLAYSSYNITVFATSHSYEGTRSSILLETSPADSPEETIHITSHMSYQTHIIVNWELLSPCETVRGPLEYELVIGAKNSPSHSARYTTVKYTYTFTGLTPFTDYTISVWLKYKYNHVTNSNSLTCDAKTKPSEPREVTELTAYQKSSTSIYLRWRAPSPPTGILKTYIITYKQKGPYSWSRLKVYENRGYECPLWPEYTCFDITNDISAETNYFCKVSAKNEYVPNNGPEREVNVETREGSSSIPINLTAIWCDDVNFLNISWSHPFTPGGIINKFVITCSNTDILATQTLPVTMANYTDRYTMQFTQLHRAATYQVTAHADTRYSGSVASTSVVVPPDVPLFSNNEQPTADCPSATTTSVNIRIPPLHTTYANCMLLIIVTDLQWTDRYSQLDEYSHIWNYTDFGSHSWLAGILQPSKDFSSMFTVGNYTENKNYNYPVNVSSGTISLILFTSYKNFTKKNHYHLEQCPIRFVSDSNDRTSNDNTGFNVFYLLFLPIIIILVALCYVAYRYKVLQLNKGHFRQIIPRQHGNSVAVREMDPDLIPLTQHPNHIQHSLKKVKMPLLQTVDKDFEEDSAQCVKTAVLKQYVKDGLQNGTLEQQYQKFPREQTQAHECGSRPENKAKNRYANLIAYDETRVVLVKLLNDPYSDYINANYVDSFRHKKAYIATQGPKPKTLNDFWRMVWQEKAKYIIMLTNVEESGKKKCEQYWPNINETKIYGEVNVYLENILVHSDFICRHLLVSCNGTRRMVEQIHFTTWPDHGVPLYPKSLVPLLKRIVAIALGPPIIIHCSAGVGRTGTIILCDICLRMAASIGSVNILGYLTKIREQRSNLVDNVDQYKLVHLVLLECLVTTPTSIPCTSLEHDIKNLLSTTGKVKAQLDDLAENMWLDNAMRAPANYKVNEVHRVKNRIAHIVPDENGRIFISRYPVEDDNADYVNAVYVDGYRSKNQFIVTQQPMPNTLVDFWRLVFEKNISLIFSLNSIDTNDETCVEICPNVGCEILPMPYMKIKHLKTVNYQNYDIITVAILINAKTSMDECVKRNVNVVQNTHWPSTVAVLPAEEVGDLIKLWEYAEKHGAGPGPILVTCYDGVTASGLFTAMAFVIEKIKMEQECDVCLAVRTIRHNRKWFVSSEDQFQFLYRVAITYVDSFETYANFQKVADLTK